MPRKPKSSPASLSAIPAELLEQFSNGPMTDLPPPKYPNVKLVTVLMES